KGPATVLRHFTVADPGGTCRVAAWPAPPGYFLLAALAFRYAAQRLRAAFAMRSRASGDNRRLAVVIALLTLPPAFRRSGPAAPISCFIRCATLITWSSSAAISARCRLTESTFAAMRPNMLPILSAASFIAVFPVRVLAML